MNFRQGMSNTLLDLEVGKLWTSRGLDQSIAVLHAGESEREQDPPYIIFEVGAAGGSGQRTSSADGKAKVGRLIGNSEVVMKVYANGKSAVGDIADKLIVELRKWDRLLMFPHAKGGVLQFKYFNDFAVHIQERTDWAWVVIFSCQWWVFEPRG